MAERLGAPSAILFQSGPAGRLRALAGVGAISDGASLRSLAETLGPSLTVLDPPGGTFAAGVRLGSDEGALLVFSPESPAPGGAWEAQFESASQLALSLVRAEAHGTDRLPLLHEVAVHPGGFEERLGHALQRAAELLGLDAAAFARTGGGQWLPQSVFDPLGRVFPVRPIPLGETFCAYTSRSDGPLALEDAAAAPFGISSPMAYIGAPVYVDGRCVGTFSVAGVAPRREAFSEEDRSLVEGLARWVGVALAGRAAARRRSARKANLAAFFDGSPLGMGLVQVVEGGLSFLAVNEAAAQAFGSTPDVIVGRTAVGLGLNSSLVRKWVAACETAASSRRSRRVEVEIGTTVGLRRLVTTVAPMPNTGDPRFTFVVEDVTGQSYERKSRAGASLMDQAPGATFALDLGGVVTEMHGELSVRLGLEGAVGQSVLLLIEGVPGALDALRSAHDGRPASWRMDIAGESVAVHVGPRRDAEGAVVGVVGTAVPAAGGGRPARGAILRHLNAEIRSPMTAVMGYAELLDGGSSPDEIAEVRDAIVRSGERLLGTLDDLVDLTVLDDEDLASTPAPTDVCVLVSSIADAYRTAAEARRIDLEVACDLSETLLLLDGALLERAVRHLIGDAVASSTSDRVDVVLSEKVAGRLELTITGARPSASALSIGPELVQRVIRAMDGTATQHTGDEPRWVLRLPMRHAPVVDLEAAGRDGARGEAPAMVIAEGAR